MFSYEPQGGRSCDCVTINESGDIKFDPPVYEQRYATTLNIIEDPRWTHHFKKVVDFGCNEMKLLPLMRRIETLEHIMEVDIDKMTLEAYRRRGMPLTVDYIKQRKRPLRIEIFLGSVTDSVENLRNVDVVIALELIEHLEQDVLEKVPSNIFGFIQPKLAIFSTPNQEYNVLFNGLNARGFRVDDHKFEWTREEFRLWANNICQQYPNYAVAYVGIGSPPPNRTELGHVTQMAIFARKDIINRPLSTPIKTDLPADHSPSIQYKEIYAVDFPFYIDDRTNVQKIKDETVAYLYESQSTQRYHNPERQIYQIPIKYLNSYAQSIDSTKEDVLTALMELNFKVENEFIILTEEYVEETYRSMRYSDEDDYDYDREFLPNEEVVSEPEENWD